MDLGLPDIREDKPIARLKTDPSTKHLPVLVITAYYSAPLWRAPFAAGACEVLYKRGALPILEETLDRVTDRHAK